MGETNNDDNLVTDPQKSPDEAPNSALLHDSSEVLENVEQSDTPVETGATLDRSAEQGTQDALKPDEIDASAQALTPVFSPVPHNPQDVDPYVHLTTYDKLMHTLFSAAQLAMNSTPAQRFWGWMAPLLVAVVGGIIRFVRLGTPDSLVFDETYYVKAGYTLMREGYEADWPDEIDETWNSGNLDSYLTDKGDYVVHPPLGKYMISLGMRLGDPHNPAFWRMSTAIVSVIAIFLIARTLRNMTGSLTVGLLAGGFMAIDGVSIVHARTGLLDSFLMFWVVVAFALLVKDRDWRRRKLARIASERIDQGLTLDGYGPHLGWSWWRFAGAIALGLSCGIKWSGLYFVAVFCVMIVIWDWNARKSIGVQSWFWGGFWREAVPSALIMLPTVLVTYLLAWLPWFRHSESYGRNWSDQNPGSYPSWTPDWLTSLGESLRSLWNYHTQMMSFHTGLSSEHTYESNPWGWLLQLRPTSFYWNGNEDGTLECWGDDCIAAVTSVGNPLIWWLGTIALVGLLFAFYLRANWISGALLAGVAAGWVPWLFFPERTIFTFYTIAFAPFLYMALAYAAYLMWQELAVLRGHRTKIKVLFAVLGSLILVLSIFFYPIWTAIPVPRDFWQLHMWMPSWI